MVLIGRLVPFNVPTSGVVEPALGLREQIDIGAFGPAALSADALRFCHFRVNHDRATMPPGARVELFTRQSGLYVLVMIPESREARAIAAVRDRWLGLSVSYDKSDITSRIDWTRRLRHIARIGFVSQASLVTEGRPAYPTTWVMEYGPAALARIEQDNDAAMRPDDDRARLSWRGRFHGHGFPGRMVGCYGEFA